MMFDDIQKIWDSDKNENLYIINSNGMEKIIKSKNKAAGTRVNRVEQGLMWMNIILPLGLILFAALKGKHKAGVYFMEAFMFLTAAYISYHRRLRIKSQQNWDKTMLGSLDEAIHNASYQARLTSTLLVWYLLGLGVISILLLIAEGEPLWLVLLMAGFFAGAFWLGKWEQRCFHDRYRDELLDLKSKLTT